MTKDQKVLAAETVAAVVRDALGSRNPPGAEEVKRLALATVDALTAAFSKINAAD